MSVFSQIGKMAEKERGLLSQVVGKLTQKGEDSFVAGLYGREGTSFPSMESGGMGEQPSYGQEMSAEHRALARASQQTARRAAGGRDN